LKVTKGRNREVPASAIGTKHTKLSEQGWLWPHFEPWVPGIAVDCHFWPFSHPRKHETMKRHKRQHLAMMERKHSMTTRHREIEDPQARCKEFSPTKYAALVTAVIGISRARCFEGQFPNSVRGQLNPGESWRLQSVAVVAAAVVLCRQSPAPGPGPRPRLTVSPPCPSVKLPLKIPAHMVPLWPPNRQVLDTRWAQDISPVMHPKPPHSGRRRWAPEKPNLPTPGIHGMHGMHNMRPASASICQHLPASTLDQPAG
jgi:hypothetical protein